MPSAGLAALVQILGQSFAGLPKGMAEAEDMQMKERDRALREKAFGLQERADQRAEAAQFTDVPGIGRLPTALAGVAFGDQLRRQTEERERGRRAGALDKATGLYNLREAMPEGVNPYGRPDTGGPLGDLPAMPPAPVSMPTRPSKMDIAAQIAQAGPGADTLAKLMFPEKPITILPAGATALGPDGKPITKAPMRPKVDMRPGAGDTFAITTDPETGEPIGKPRPLGIGAPESKGAYTRGDIEDQLRLEGKTPGTLAWRQRYNDLARQIPIAPGGAVFGPGTGLGVPATPGAPLASRPAMPSSGEREDLANLDAVDTALGYVITSLKNTKSGLGAVMGGVFKNPAGALARTSEEYLGYGMSDEQRRAMGVLSIQLQAIKHALIGATRTRPELADIAAAIPDEKSILRGDSAEQAIQKLEATLMDLRNKRAARENAMRQSGVATPLAIGRPEGAPPAPTSTGQVIWVLRDKSGRERRYQPDPGETQPPAGYERVR